MGMMMITKIIMKMTMFTRFYIFFLQLFQNLMLFYVFSEENFHIFQLVQRAEVDEDEEGRLVIPSVKPEDAGGHIFIFVFVFVLVFVWSCLLSNLRMQVAILTPRIRDSCSVTKEQANTLSIG